MIGLATREAGKLPAQLAGFMLGLQPDQTDLFLISLQQVAARIGSLRPSFRCEMRRDNRLISALKVPR